MQPDLFTGRAIRSGVIFGDLVEGLRIEAFKEIL